MTKLVRALALMTALAALTGGAVTLAAAQDTKKAAKDDKKKEKDEKPGSVEVYKGKDGYRYRIKNADGKTIAIGTKGYEKKDDVIKVLDEIKETLNSVKPTDAKP